MDREWNAGAVVMMEVAIFGSEPSPAAVHHRHHKGNQNHYDNKKTSSNNNKNNMNNLTIKSPKVSPVHESVALLNTSAVKTTHSLLPRRPLEAEAAAAAIPFANATICLRLSDAT
jgi:hypothetical protein